MPGAWAFFRAQEKLFCARGFAPTTELPNKSAHAQKHKFLERVIGSRVGDALSIP
jgi:hypothetical protein